MNSLSKCRYFVFGDKNKLSTKLKRLPVLPITCTNWLHFPPYLAVSLCTHWCILVRSTAIPNVFFVFCWSFFFLFVTIIVLYGWVFSTVLLPETLTLVGDENKLDVFWSSTALSLATLARQDLCSKEGGNWYFLISVF